MGRFRNRISKDPETSVRDARDHIGTVIKAARLESGASLQDIAQSLCIQEKYLRAIEHLDRESFPGMGYALGYVRAYARHLKLEPVYIVATFKRDIGWDITTSMSGANRSARTPSRGRYAFGTLLGCIMVVLSWYGLKPDAHSASIEPPTPLSEAVVTPIAIPDPVLSFVDASRMIDIKAVGPSWVEVLDENGDVIASRILVPGESITTSKDVHPVISARDGGAIDLYVGGKRVGPLGAHGQALDEISIPIASE